MVSADAIIDFTDAVVAEVSPMKVILFGSYPHGSANEDSDVDLLVVMDFRGRAERKAARIRTALPTSFALDLLVRRQSDIDRRIGWNDFFLQDVMKNGLVLYAANDPRMGEQGRKRLRRCLAPAPLAQT